MELLCLNYVTECSGGRTNIFTVAFHLYLCTSVQKKYSLSVKRRLRDSLVHFPTEMYIKSFDLYCLGF